MQTGNPYKWMQMKHLSASQDDEVEGFSEDVIN